jgi:uncharacterized protein
MEHFIPITKPPKCYFAKDWHDGKTDSVHAKDISLIKLENGTTYLYIKKSGLTFKLSKTAADELYGQTHEIRLTSKQVADEWELLFKLNVFAPLPLNYDKPDITTLNINICHSCNISCMYCFANRGKYDGEENIMPIPLAYSIVQSFICHLEKIKKKGKIVLFGGEPLLAMETIFCIAKQIKDETEARGVNIWLDIFTNATLVDDNFINLVKEYENIRLLISLDGYPEINDIYRYHKSFRVSDRVEKAITQLKIEGISADRIVVRCTVGGLENDLCKRIEYFASLGFTNIVIDAAYLNDDTLIPANEKILHSIEQQLPEIKNLLMHFRKAGNHININLISEMASRILNPNEENQYMSQECPAGKKYLAADCEGNLFPCHFFVGDKKHQINHVSNGFVQKDMLKQDGYPSLYKNNFEQCSKCEIAGLCEGICAYKYNKMGDNFSFWMPSFCSFMKERVINTFSMLDSCYGSKHPYDHAWRILLKRN